MNSTAQPIAAPISVKRSRPSANGLDPRVNSSPRSTSTASTVPTDQHDEDQPGPHRGAAHPVVAGDELGRARNDEGHQHQAHRAPEADACGALLGVVPGGVGGRAGGVAGGGVVIDPRSVLGEGSTPTSITSPSRPTRGDAPDQAP